MFFHKPKRRPILTLNVTALIDICSLILIFLVMESFFGESSIVVPPGMKIPFSVSKESAENAPRVVISATDVSADFINETIPLTRFRPNAGADQQISALKDKLKAFIDKIPADARGSGILLNVIADQKAPYRNIFDVISLFREAGFQSMLFVAEVKE